MFIRSVSSGGGYRGDVNTSFRQGRQDAFRDYIDNFKFALSADAANNAENQRQVERVAKNYGLDLDMDQAARQDAYNFITQSSAIDNAKTQRGIDFQRNSHLKDPTVQAELGKAKASEYVANTQVGAVKANYDLADWNFKQEQQPVTQQTTANNNQADLTKSETAKITERIRQNGAVSQQDLVDMANSLSDKEIEDFYIERMNALNPNHGLTLDQLKAEARNNSTDLRIELAKQKANNAVATVVLAGGNLSGSGSGSGVYSFDPSVKGNQTKVTGGSKAKTDEPKPVTVKSLGKVVGLSKEDFDKISNRMDNLGTGIYRDGNAIVVDNGRGSYVRYEASKMSDGTWENEKNLINRAVEHARGTSSTQSSAITKPTDMNK